MSKKNIGPVLRNYRKDLKLSVEEVSQMLKLYDINISPKTIYNYETSFREPDADTLMALCEIYNIRNVLDTFGYTNSNCTDNQQEKLILSQDDKLALSLFQQLDDNDKAEIRGEMKHMLKAEKYSVQEELKNA